MARGARILIAEDDPTLARLLEVALERYGRVYLATDGLDAVRAAREIAPDLVHSDLLMPRMGGAELCRRLRLDPDTSSIRIVLMSATNQPQPDECDPDAFFAKPFDIAELTDTIRELLATTRNSAHAP